MLIRNFSLPIINYIKLTSFQQRTFYGQCLNNNYNKFSFSTSSQSNDQKQNKNINTYMPIRPLKKNLTTLYTEREYLNKGQVIKKIPLWPFLTPFLAMCINNYLTTWSVLNTTVASILFVLGFLIRRGPKIRRQREIVKFECNQQMTKYYMTFLDSNITYHLYKYYRQCYRPQQDMKIFTDQELRNPQYIPTDEELRTLSKQQLQAKKKDYDNKLFQKIMKQKLMQKKIARYELDPENTYFKFSKIATDTISDKQLTNQSIFKVQQMLNFPLKYLIVRTEFIRGRYRIPLHFYIDLTRNGDLKYQDYLIALGVNAKIIQNSQTK